MRRPGERVIVDLASRHRGRPLVEQPGEGANQPGLPLSALAEQDHVVPGDDRALQVGQDRLTESDDPGERILARAHPGQQVAPDFLLDRARLVITGAEFA